MIHGTDSVIAIDSLLAPLKHEPNMRHFAGKPKLLFVQVTVRFYPDIDDGCHFDVIWSADSVKLCVTGADM